MTADEAATILSYARFILPITLCYKVESEVERESGTQVATNPTSMTAASPFLAMLYAEEHIGPCMPWHLVLDRACHLRELEQTMQMKSPRPR